MSLLDDYDEAGFDSPLEMLESLVRMNSPELKGALLEAIEDHDSRLRVVAAFYLAEHFGDVRALPGLYEALQSWDRGWQVAASDAIWELGDQDAASLIRALHFERDSIREAIAGALTAIGWFPDDVEQEVAYRIATRNWKALVQIGGDAVSGLVSALSDPDGNIRRGSAWALGDLGDARAVPFLIKALEDRSGDMFNMGHRVCDVAAAALEQIGTEEALRAVENWMA